MKIQNRIIKWKTVSGFEDKAEELDHLVKENDQVFKNHGMHAGSLGCYKRTRAMNYSCRKRRNQVKGIENIFNKVIEENFPNLGKETPSRCKRHAEHS